jgi:hypothetical protein
MAFALKINYTKNTGRMQTESHSLLVAMQNTAATLKDSLAVS